MPTPGGSLADITSRLHHDIPLTQAMQISVTHWDGHTVSLAAPLAPNHNHTDTAFGGSISALSILAGYTLLHLLLDGKKIPAHLLIQKSATDFLRPIDTALLASASLPAANLVEDFLTTLQQKRRARLSLDSAITTHDTLAATHTGLYVAILS